VVEEETHRARARRGGRGGATGFRNESANVYFCFFF
jgi:hypothetical protein